MKLIRIQDYDPDKKRRLIIKLCDLRIKLNQMNEDFEQQYFFGHRFSSPSSKSSSTLPDGHNTPPVVTSLTCLTCDVCRKKQRMILLNSVLNGSNQIMICDFCDFNLHKNCMMGYIDTNRIRKCPKLLLEDEEEMNPELKYSKLLEFRICPEIGLSKQQFKCFDCGSRINLNNSRLDDYDGLYYCLKCHWDDYESTPGRILHNWDDTKHPVSRRSLQILNYIKRKPILFDVMEFNSMLYGLIEDLPIVKRIRTELSQMATYLKLCHQPNKPRLNHIKEYLLEETKINYFSLSDLINLEQLKKQLIEHHLIMSNHITFDCEVRFDCVSMNPSNQCLHVGMSWQRILLCPMFGQRTLVPFFYQHFHLSRLCFSLS